MYRVYIDKGDRISSLDFKMINPTNPLTGLNIDEDDHKLGWMRDEKQETVELEKKLLKEEFIKRQRLMELEKAKTVKTVTEDDADKKFHVFKNQVELRGETVSRFLGKGQVDYQGRSWTHPPPTLRPGSEEHRCFMPKKCVMTLKGHKAGVSKVRYISEYGHLLASAGKWAKISTLSHCDMYIAIYITYILSHSHCDILNITTYIYIIK